MPPRPPLGRILLVTAFAAAVQLAPAAGYLWDPVVTYTNGMRLASTTSLRSHNAYWQCDRGHIGYCDGRMHGPCCNELRELGTRDHGRFVLPYGTAVGPSSREAPHSHDGLENADSEPLGLLPAVGIDGVPVGGPAPTTPGAPAATPAPAPVGGVWLDAIETIGRKMMTGEG